MQVKIERLLNSKKKEIVSYEYGIYFDKTKEKSFKQPNDE